MATVAPYNFGDHVECAAFVAGEPCFATVQGVVHFPVKGTTLSANDGLLAAVPALDRAALLTGGEDGRVMRVSPDGAEVVAEKSGKWIDVLAAGPNGAVGFASGRTAWLASGQDVKEFVHDRAVEALAFMPKGLRLVCARYNGVSLHWGAGGKSSVLEWDGAHIAVSVSPDGRYVVTGMAENALHGWRLDAKKAQDAHMRMSGYPAKPKSLSWSAKGKWLASSGAPAAICWPFSGKDGPQGKAPKELGTRGDTMVVQVACHPVADVVAIGYSDGMVMAVKIDDGAEHVLRRAGKGAVSTMTWDAKGDRLVFGTEAGEAGVISL